MNSSICLQQSRARVFLVGPHAISLAPAMPQRAPEDVAKATRLTTLLVIVKAP